MSWSEVELQLVECFQSSNECFVLGSGNFERICTKFAGKFAFVEFVGIAWIDRIRSRHGSDVVGFQFAQIRLVDAKWQHQQQQRWQHWPWLSVQRQQRTERTGCSDDQHVQRILWQQESRPAAATDPAATVPFVPAGGQKLERQPTATIWTFPQK